MDNKELYNYAELCVTRLGKLVGELRQHGKDIGLTEAQTKKVWVTAFEVLNEKQRISRQLMSQNLRRK